MRTLLILVTIFAISPALAHPGHVESSGGHSHWFELAVAGLVLALVVGSFVSRLRKRPVADNG